LKKKEKKLKNKKGFSWKKKNLFLAFFVKIRIIWGGGGGGGG